MKQRFLVVACTVAAATVPSFAAWAAGAADLVVYPGPLEVLSATTMNGVTNRYDGLDSVIRDNLTIDKRSYVRIKGGDSTTHATLKVGPADSSAANQRPVVTIKGDSGFYGEYKTTANFLGETATAAAPSYLDTTIGENGGSALFLVQSKGKYFGSAVANAGLWLDYVTVSPNATSDGDTIDILQLDSGSEATFQRIEPQNDKPTRLLFNGGVLSYRYECLRTSGLVSLYADTGKKLILKGINGNSIDIYKRYRWADLVAGTGTIRFETDADFKLGSAGDN